MPRGSCSKPFSHRLDIQKFRENHVEVVKARVAIVFFHNNIYNCKGKNGKHLYNTYNTFIKNNIQVRSYSISMWWCFIRQLMSFGQNGSTPALGLNPCKYSGHGNIIIMSSVCNQNAWQVANIPMISWQCLNEGMTNMQSPASCEW